LSDEPFTIFVRKVAVRDYKIKICPKTFVRKIDLGLGEDEDPLHVLVQPRGEGQVLGEQRVAHVLQPGLPFPEDFGKTGRNGDGLIDQVWAVIFD
jgi:hypothetical protein